MKINTNQTIDLTSNDVLLGSGSVYNVLSLSTNARDFSGNFETITLDGNSDGRSDVRVSLDGNDLQVEALSGGAAGRYNLYYKLGTNVSSDGEGIGAIVIDVCQRHQF